MDDITTPKTPVSQPFKRRTFSWRRALVIVGVLTLLALIYRGFINMSLIQAAKEGDLQQTALLLNMGASVNVVDESVTPLMNAAHSGNLKLVELLVSRGADVNMHDYLGYTPLMNAASDGNVGITQFLLAHNADINAKSSEGQTALMQAAENNHPKIVQLLSAAH